MHRSYLFAFYDEWGMSEIKLKEKWLISHWNEFCILRRDCGKISKYTQEAV